MSSGFSGMCMREKKQGLRGYEEADSSFGGRTHKEQKGEKLETQSFRERRLRLKGLGKRPKTRDRNAGKTTEKKNVLR